MTPEERRSIENGVWLCQSCGKLVDGDEATWTVAELRQIKSKAEEKAKAAIGSSKERSQGRLVVHAKYCQYVQHLRCAFVPLKLINERRKGVSIHEAILSLDGVDYRPMLPHVNFTVGECPWLEPPPLRLDGADAKYGAWYFGPSFLSGSRREVVARPDSIAELLVMPVGCEQIRVELEFHYPEKTATEGNS
jgi:hypothetical protein